MSKMGISTLQSYKGAQIFEALGLHHEVVSACFVGTASRIEGATFELLAMDAFEFHERGFPSRDIVGVPGLVRQSPFSHLLSNLGALLIGISFLTQPQSGEYHWRDSGEAHINDPTGIANLQDAVRMKNQTAYDNYSKNAQAQIKNITLRGLLDFDYDKTIAIPLDQVEPWNEIARRYVNSPAERYRY